ncbi:hypothetical protein K443DRAFT_129627 [Laccaria amethystina LaAM-08-1]|uniref:Telomere length regulation protein conserved domain-containing protein n=1 Tax=Laccaria amethystina LaAM-08-1 TaxID=1095629 RepID=A0A0C9XNC4_9AGAR|nr:hypothetical protein K443DRAFT_129627 [Laccaria amethystina LaAM-08-1]
MVQAPATDFSAFVLDILSHTTHPIDQKVLCHCLQLASSFLVTDLTMDPQHGLSTWSLGLSRIVDVVLALHARDELEVATLSAASMACSECWTTAGSFKGMQDSRAKVREIGNKLKKLLDPNRRTYKVYAP